MSQPLTNVLGKTLNISVSAADTFDDCNLKWLFNYYYKIPQAPKESTRIGNAVHDALEHMLKKGIWPKGLENPRHRIRVMAERALLASGLVVVEGEGVQGGWETEEWTPKGLTCGPLPFKGKVDVHRLDPLRRIVTEGTFPGPSGGILQVWDWKTSKNPLARYNPTPATLGYKRQPLAYGYALGTKYGLEGQPFTTRYIYTSTTDHTAFPLDADEPIPWERAVEEWERMEVLAHQMADIAKRAEGQPTETFVSEVPRNTRACKKYGGCDFANICPFSPANKVEEEFTPTISTSAINPEKLMSTNTNGLAALAGLAGVSAEDAPTAAITPASKPAPAPAPPAPSENSAVLANAASQVTAMLAAGPFAAGIPAGMLSGMVSGWQGITLEQLVEAAGLVLKDGKYVVAPDEPEAEPVPSIEEGTALQFVVENYEEKWGLTQLFEGNGLVPYLGLLVKPETMAEAEAKGAEGVGWLYSKFQGDNEGVAAAVEVVQAVESEAPAPAAPTDGAALTAAQELQLAAEWLEGREWTTEGVKLSTLKDELKVEVLAHRQRLSASFVEKAIKRLNKKGKALVVEGETTATKVVRPSVEALAAAEQAPTVGVYYVDAAGEPSEPIDAPSLEEQLAEVEPEAPATPAQEPEKGCPVGPLNTSLTIYVDVVVEGTPLPPSENLDLWAKQFEGQVMAYAKSQGMKGADTGTWQLIEYGKGSGLYARVFNVALAEGSVPDMRVFSRSPLADVFLSCARAHGDVRIFRGVR